MELREWQSGDFGMLGEWAETDPAVGNLIAPMGVMVTREYLDASVPEKAVAVEGGEVVGVVGWQMYGTGVAAVHIIGAPGHRTFAEMSKVYDLGFEKAQQLGIVIAIATIPIDNKAAQMMAMRKGFTVVPTVIMTKVLPNGKEG